MPSSQAALIFDAFRAYQTRFHAITCQAARRFAKRDWRGLRADATERLTLYREIVDRAESDLRRRLGQRVHDKALWADIRSAYSQLAGDRRDAELAETFYNSITRRIFDTVGVDPAIEFVTTDIDDPHAPPEAPVTRVFEGASSTAEYVAAILDAYAFNAPYADRDADVARVSRFIDRRLADRGFVDQDFADRDFADRGVAGPITRVELARNVFFRGIGAYLVGRLLVGSRTVPFTLALHHDADGIAVDAVLLNEDDVSILFSFARSYFHVVAPHPHALVEFLETILPLKRTAELYIAIGYNKHGKTELYRYMLRSFQNAPHAFVRAEGQRGMVMTVFGMQDFPFVFKIIKDAFDPPKTATRQTVKDRYHLVFRHDRAGRLVDAQEFEHLRLHRRLFSEALLDELLDVAGETVHRDGDRVVIEHCYVERRVTPLDVFVRTRSEDEARAALIEYGNAIKDLARTNIFPGDLLLKNFGVTRHGRVVFYDYDELGFLTDYTFRDKPQAQTYYDELSADAWFYVGPDDVFPEEFKVTMGVDDALMAAFERDHADIFTADFWRATQERIENDDVIPILPYPPQERLPYRRLLTPEELSAP